MEINPIHCCKWQSVPERGRAEASGSRKPCREATLLEGTALIGPHTADGSKCVLEGMCLGC